MQFPKDKTYRSESYKAYIRTLPCVVCGASAECHHEVGGGMGIKGSDLFSIPLCRDDHRKREDMGKQSFWEEVNKDRWQVIAQTLVGYVERIENENPRCA